MRGLRVAVQILAVGLEAVAQLCEVEVVGGLKVVDQGPWAASPVASQGGEEAI